jgi:hypothetical protein
MVVVNIIIRLPILTRWCRTSLLRRGFLRALPQLVELAQGPPANPRPSHYERYREIGIKQTRGGEALWLRPALSRRHMAMQGPELEPK